MFILAIQGKGVSTSKRSGSGLGSYRQYRIPMSVLFNQLTPTLTEDLPGSANFQYRVLISASIHLRESPEILGIIVRVGSVWEANFK
jgi:hypothetical protein